VQTLGTFLDVWLKQVALKGVRPKTYRTYSDIVNLHIKPVLGAIQVEKLTPDIVQVFLNDKLGSALCPHCKASVNMERMSSHVKENHPNAKAKAARPLGAKTVAHVRATLRSALAVAMEWYDLDRNVASLAKPPRAVKKEMRSLTPGEARRYLDVAAGDRLEALFMVTVALGLRQGEILGLSWGDVDLKNSALSVRRQLQRINGKLELVETKTTDAARPLILPAVAISALTHHQMRQEEERAAAGDQWKESGLVFTTTIGTPLDARSVIRRHHAIVKAANIPRLRFHDLRHSAATLLLAQGVSPKYISQMLGHRQVAFTMQTYAHVIKETQQQLADKMDAILNPVAPQVAPSGLSRGVN
jgi:integrase